MADLKDAIEGITAALRKSIDEVAPAVEGGPPGPDELLTAFEVYRSRSAVYRKERETIHTGLVAALNGKDGTSLRGVEHNLYELRRAEEVATKARDHFVGVLARLLAPVLVGERFVRALALAPAQAPSDVGTIVARPATFDIHTDPMAELEGTAGSVPAWRCAACGIGRQAIDSGKPCPACGGTVLRDADGKVPMFVAVGAEVHDATPPAPDPTVGPDGVKRIGRELPDPPPTARVMSLHDTELLFADLEVATGDRLDGLLPFKRPLGMTDNVARAIAIDEIKRSHDRLRVRTAGPAGVAASILADVADDFRARRQLAAPIMSINVACPRCRVTPIPAEPGHATQCGSCREWFVLCSHCRDQRIKMPGAPTLPAQGHCLCGAIFDLI
jgi:hypothetical protein